MASSALLKRSYTDTGLLILRLGIGFFMILKHGYPKLEQLLRGDTGFSDPLGVGSTPSLLLAIFAELVCSVFLMLGWFTRLALVPLIILMVVIIFIHNIHKGVLGQEMAALYLVAYTGLFFTGAGRYSLDTNLHGKGA